MTYLADWQRLDLALTRAIWTEGEGFGLARNASLLLIRDGFMGLSDAVVILAVALLLLGAALPAVRIVRMRVLGYVVTLFALGPGLAVGTLKTVFGRPRPYDLTVFGGTADYVRPFEISAQCRHGCSFVSAETSSIVAVVAILCLIVTPHLSRRIRGLTDALICAAAVLCAGLRVTFGAHFLSDVVFAALLTASLALALYLAFGLDRMTTPLLPLTRTGEIGRAHV